MFMCVVNQKPVNKLDLTWKQSFLIHRYTLFARKKFAVAKHSSLFRRIVSDNESKLSDIESRLRTNNIFEKPFTKSFVVR
jgi:hypothetical protein